MGNTKVLSQQQKMKVRGSHMDWKSGGCRRKHDEIGGERGGGNGVGDMLMC